MPLIACDKKTNKRVFISDAEQIREKYEPGDLICPLCKEKFFIRSAHLRTGAFVRPHFYHASPCQSGYRSHPETAMHISSKLWLAGYLQKKYPHCTIDIEVPIDMEWRPRGRVADVLVTWPNGWKAVFEIQLASISVEELRERTSDYFKCGIDTRWLLGRNANKPENRIWMVEHFGDLCWIEFDLQETGLSASEEDFDGQTAAFQNKLLD